MVQTLNHGSRTVWSHALASVLEEARHRAETPQAGAERQLRGVAVARQREQQARRAGPKTQSLNFLGVLSE